MGKVADKYCDEIILTDDDSYDEDTTQICAEIAAGITNHQPQIIVDRREAIKTALVLATASPSQNVTVLITGKGTDPYLMGPKGQKTPWSDANVVREELAKLI
jgi:UDP-N-acetylmuramoyl-L-alanyl-D-glutamate--2,6-diaminopimelate ligase